MRKFTITSILMALIFPAAFAQGRREAGPDQAPKDPIVEAILQEENNNSQLQLLAHQLFEEPYPVINAQGVSAPPPELSSVLKPAVSSSLP